MKTILIKAKEIIDHNGDSVGDSVLIEDCKIDLAGYGLDRKYAKVLHLDGFVAPGFVDAHLHIAGLGLSLFGADLRNVRSSRELAERLRKVSGPIAFGRGWDQENFEEKNYPTRRELDVAVNNRPAIAIRVCGHVAVLNTIALEITEPWKKFPEFVDKENGLVFEDAVSYVLEKLLNKIDIMPLIEKAVNELYKVGIRGVSSMSCSLREFRSLSVLDEKGRLPIFVSCYSPLEEVEKIVSIIGQENVLRRRVDLVGVKLFADGSLGARTAFLREPYEDKKGTRGRKLLSSSDIVNISSKYLKAGLRIATHAIGDAALDEVIDAYSKLGIGENGRVEHVSISWDDQIKRLAELGVYAVVQPRFRVSDWWMKERLGSRYKLCYRFRSLISSGVKVALSTDAPVEPFDPVLTFASAVGRCEGVTCRREESLTPKEVIKAYTLTSSRASGGPVNLIGTLEKGSFAALSWTPNDPRKYEWNGPLRPIDLC